MEEIRVQKQLVMYGKLMFLATVFGKRFKLDYKIHLQEYTMQQVFAELEQQAE